MNGTPWWQALSLRPEVVGASGQIDDVQMSLFQAVYGQGALRPPYADPEYFVDITHPTDRLVDLLSEVAIRLGGGTDYLKARAVTRLDQGMGGGKSHACIAAYHLAMATPALRSSELGRAVFEECRLRLNRELPADLGRPRVVVLPCDNMTPGATDEAVDGPARSLYERFLWRLFEGDYKLYERYKPFFNNKAKIADALRSAERPILVIIDEVMNYLGNASDGDPVLAGQDLEFLRAALDALNDVPHVAAIVVMIASDRDPMAQSQEAKDRRADLNALLDRNATPATVTANADFAAILRRRLFSEPPKGNVVAATAETFGAVLKDRAWKRHVWDNVVGTWKDDFSGAVSRTYPFHPHLIYLAEHEWAAVAGFQRVRSTIRIFAATVYALSMRAAQGEWAPSLIGPGDLPLSDNNVREALLGSGLVDDERTVANYRALAENEVVNHDDNSGAARLLDLARHRATWTDSNPRAAERGATFIFVSSIVGTRPGGRRGASGPEVKAAMAVPDLAFGLADADGVVEELADSSSGLSALEVLPGQGNNRPARYYLSTRLTLRMLINNLRKNLSGEADKAAEEGRPSWRDVLIAEFASRLTNSGPFAKRLFIAADLSRRPSEVLATAGIDDARTTRLAVLDPAQFAIRTGNDAEMIAALEGAFGIGAANTPVEWASSVVFVVMNGQRRTHARGLAVEYEARRLALETPEVQADEDLRVSGTSELNAARTQLEKAIRRAFQHVVYLGQATAESARTLEVYTLEDDNQTGLDGTQSWKALVEREKAFDSGQFTAKALVHNLRASDYGRPLSEVRDAFWSAPRLPLLFGGEADLRQAIYDAVASGQLIIADGTGQPVAVTTPSQVNLTSTGLRLLAVEATSEPLCPICGAAAHGGSCAGDKPIGGEGDPTPIVKEKLISIPLVVGSLIGSDSKSDDLAAVFRSLYALLDERKATYLQGTLQLVLTTESADVLVAQLQGLGFNVTVRDQ